MVRFFQKFRFDLLGSPEFKEDSVREELITPILAHLGYSSSGEHEIHRSKSLIHPFVYIGTKPHKVYIIPDYTLFVAGKPMWILDAKAPSEEIREGKHREQAYSYAMHKDIRVNLYALCNGRRFIVYHVSHEHPLLDVSLEELDESLNVIWQVVSPQALSRPHTIGFWPDLGIHHYLLGYTPNDRINTYAHIDLIARLDDDNYTIAAGADMDGVLMLGNYDFNAKLLPELLSLLEGGVRFRVKDGLKRAPFRVDLSEERPEVIIHSRMGLKIHDNGDEDYLPFNVTRFSAVSSIEAFCDKRA